MFNLIVLDCGSVLDSWLFNSRPSAVHRLSDWCRDNWHDDESDSDNFDCNESLIEYFFENWEDYSWCISEIKVPSAVPVGEDILLTPGMCAVIRNGLVQVEYGNARELMQQYDEWDEGQDGTEVVQELLNYFE